SVAESLDHIQTNHYSQYYPWFQQEISTESRKKNCDSRPFTLDLVIGAFTSLFSNKSRRELKRLSSSLLCESKCEAKEVRKGES
ncbi:hypothetical protein PIB30_094382, partial [Stylosanthes scabra]|nr:hypothetical protein [Stylosanthes scabra]